MSRRIVAISGRPDLAPLVARWWKDAFFATPGDWSVEDMTALILAPLEGPQETFVQFDSDQPAGTAGMVRTDLKSRPDLTPWLAGVFVRSAFRRRGYANALVRRVKAFALGATVAVLWEHTQTAEPLHASLGWQRMGTEQDRGHDVTLMRRVQSEGGPSFGSIQ